MVGTNYGTSQFEPGPDRKNWVGGLEAFSDVLKDNPKVKLYIHSNAEGAVDLPTEIDKLGISDSVFLADQDCFSSGNWSFGPEHIADIYRASDVYFMPSLGEGFGIPLIEAQACGVGVVATDSGPMTELVRTGTVVTSTPHPDRPEWMLPDRGAMADALVDMIIQGRLYFVDDAVAEFNIEAVVEDLFIPALEATANSLVTA
jgi:glycosyltransferase involved in cell wall biosynthesis